MFAVPHRYECHLETHFSYAILNTNHAPVFHTKFKPPTQSLRVLLVTFPEILQLLSKPHSFTHTDNMQEYVIHYFVNMHFVTN